MVQTKIDIMYTEFIYEVASLTKFGNSSLQFLSATQEEKSIATTYFHIQ